MNQNAVMLKLRSCLFLAGVVLFSAVAAPSQQLPSALTTDPPPDKEFPAAVDAPDVMSHGARLNAVFYIASGRGPHPAVLTVQGFPGNEKIWTWRIPFAARAGTF